MDKAQAASLNEELALAIAAVLEKHGLDKTKQDLRWTSEGAITWKIEASSGEAKRESLAMYASFVSIDPNEIDRIFSLAGRQLRLVRYNTRARVMPWVAEDLATGKRYKLTDEQVQHAFASSAS